MSYDNNFQITDAGTGQPWFAVGATDQSEQLLFRSHDWLSANQGPVFPDSAGSWLIAA